MVDLEESRDQVEQGIGIEEACFNRGQLILSPVAHEVGDEVVDILKLGAWRIIIAAVRASAPKRSLRQGARPKAL